MDSVRKQEAAANDKIKVCIVVQAGFVAEVFASAPEKLDVVILDFDGADEKDLKEIESQYQEVRKELSLYDPY